MPVKVGYGFCRAEAEFEELGLDRVWIDTEPERPNRLDMIQDSLGEGDTVVVLSWVDLAGATPASDRLARRLRARGIDVELAELGPDTVSRNTRIRRTYPLDTTPEEDAQIERIWHDPIDTVLHKRRLIADLLGRPVETITRAQLYGRYGTPDRPKHPSQRAGALSPETETRVVTARCRSCDWQSGDAPDPRRAAEDHCQTTGHVVDLDVYERLHPRKS